MAENWGEVWREQEGGPPLDVRLRRRREWELSSRTRAEILASLGAALLFMAVIGWRFSATYGRLPSTGLAVMAAWVAISLVWFQRRIRGEAAADSVTAPGVEHYRKELERRRDHLRNVWIWNGPVIAACVTLFLIVDSPMAMRQLGTIAPLLIALGAWTVFGVVRRRRQANELQREIDDLEP